LVLKETVRGYRWTAVAVGFGGVLIMMAPHLGEGLSGVGGAAPVIGAMFALLGASCSAFATIQVRRLTGTESTGAIVLYFSLLTTALGLITVALGWRMPDAGDLALLVLIGILGGIGQILLTGSYRFGDASLIAPFEYTTMIWALLIGWFAFDQLPDQTVAIGGALVAASGIFVLWRERRLGLMRAKGLRAGPQRAA
jgi:drug/metabolite transporter (DMT)-like permease